MDLSDPRLESGRLCRRKSDPLGLPPVNVGKVCERAVPRPAEPVHIQWQKFTTTAIDGAQIVSLNVWKYIAVWNNS